MPPKRIVLIHGWGASTASLAPLEKSLQRLGWQVFLVKLPGFDLKPPKKPWGVNEYKNCVLRKAKLKFGRKKFFVFGHSFGGRIALKLAYQNPEKLFGVILCATSGLSRPNIFKILVFFVLAKAGKLLNFYPPLANLWRAVLYKLARSHDYQRTKGVMRETFKKVIAEDLKPLVKRIHTPTLILWGKEDQATPFKDALFLKNNIKKSRLIAFRKASHRLPYEKPDKLAEKINQWAHNL